MRFLVHVFLFIFLTILTQIGGIVYLFSLLLVKKKKQWRQLKRFFVFVLLYLSTSYFIIPSIASLAGRERIEDTAHLKAHSVFTKLLNRNYVSPELHTVLKETSLKLKEQYPTIQLIYLDANFPFFNGFPLFPHLSHNDGKKIDLSFLYRDAKKALTNDKPSNSGYGVFVNPQKGEVDQTKICKENGAWYYDFTKYLSFGTNKHLRFDAKATKDLLNLLIKHPQTKKIFIEPHLTQRMQLKSSKVRFHGCKAVRHDDHIHLQIN